MPTQAVAAHLLLRYCHFTLRVPSFLVVEVGTVVTMEDHQARDKLLFGKWSYYDLEVRACILQCSVVFFLNVLPSLLGRMLADCHTDDV